MLAARCWLACRRAKGDAQRWAGWRRERGWEARRVAARAAHPLQLLEGFSIGRAGFSIGCAGTHVAGARNLCQQARWH